MLQTAYKLSNILNSGIATSDSNVLPTRGGKVVHIPFWKRPYADDEVLSDSSGLTEHNIEAGADIACVHARGIAYSTNDLARIFAGDDPAGRLASILGEEWANNIQKLLIATLKGAFGATGMSTSIKDISTATGNDGIVSASAMIDAQYLLGDQFDKLGAVMMHSAVMAKLKKLDLIQFEKQSEASKLMPYYMGQQVIVDDALAPTNVTVGSGSGAETKAAYPIYFFGKGALAFNENTVEMRTESDRDIITGNDVITSRRVFTIHPRGIKWIGTPAGETPTNAELATAGNWELVDDRRNVAITKLVARVD